MERGRAQTVPTPRIPQRAAAPVGTPENRDRRPVPSACREGRAHAHRAFRRSTSLESPAAARFSCTMRRRPSKGAAARCGTRGAAERLALNPSDRRDAQMPKKPLQANDRAKVHATPGRVLITVSRKRLFPRRVRRIESESFSGARLSHPVIALSVVATQIPEGPLFVQVGTPTSRPALCPAV